MENSYTLNLTTKLFFGKDEHLKIGKILNEYNFHNVLIVYGKNSAVKSGLIQTITDCLKEYNIDYCFLSGVRANPTIDLVRNGLELARKENIDFILCVGGGSVIDTGKLIATSFYYNGDPFDISRHIFSPTRRTEFGVILTVSGSGSEMSNSCVIQDDKLGIKLGYTSQLNRPLFVICNPCLTFTVSYKQTCIGIVDTLMHTIERYFSYDSNENPLADDFAVGLLKNVINNSINIKENLLNYDVRSNLMLASSFSHNGITSINKEFVMPVHKLEHVISALYPDVSHGEGLSILFIAWAKYYYVYEIDKFDYLGRNLFHLSFKSKYENAKMCVNEFEKFFKSLNMPTSFKDLNLVVDSNLLVQKLLESGTRVIGHRNKDMDLAVARAIYQLAID